MTTFQQFRPLYQDLNLPKLQRDIIARCDYGTIEYKGWGAPTIKAPLSSVARAVESAYVLTPREALPKVTASATGGTSRSFTAAGGLSVSMQGGDSGMARKAAELWLAISALLETEEKAPSEAKKKAEAEKAEAERARRNRLDLIADLYFGKDFDELGDNKASAVKEIYRLEQVIAEEDAA